MEPKRYWWVHYDTIGIGTTTLESIKKGKNIVIDMHPFKWIKWKNGGDAEWSWIVNWKLIDVTEYNLFNELNNKG